MKAAASGASGWRYLPMGPIEETQEASMDFSAQPGVSQVDQDKLQSRLNPGVVAERELGADLERRVETERGLNNSDGVLSMVRWQTCGARLYAGGYFWVRVCCKHWGSLASRRRS